MVRTYAAVAVALASALLVGSCLTQREERLREFTEAPLTGMVYDHDQAPCANALVVVDGTDGPHTDINGRFATDPIGRGGHRVLVKKQGFEELEVSFEFMNRNQVLYLRVISVDQLLRQAETALEGKRLVEVERLLARAQAIDAANPVGKYLCALWHLERDEADAAADILTELERAGYREPIVFLTLADVYEFHLARTAEAILQLEQYLKLQGDPEVSKRLDELRSKAQ
jgi:hypothetical protein